MKKRRSLTHTEQIKTLKDFLESRRWTQVAFIKWLESNGVIITPQYLNDVLRGRRSAGPKFRKVFEEITGIELVDGLVEADRD